MSSIVFNTQPSDITFAEKSHAQNTVAVNEKQWNSYSEKLDKVETGSVSMSDLLALLAQIIESSQRLRAQMMQNRITEAVATSDLAVKLSGDKCSDAQRKFGITLAASVATMAMSTAATVRMGQSKTLKDKHVTDLTKGKNTSVSSLDSRSVNKFTANLQEARTAKYRSVSQMSEMASSMVGNVNEMQHADQVRKQEETQASKELKEKFDAQLDQYIQDLTQEAVKLNEILDSVAKASLVHNR
ncbi:type III secretion system protein [Vibrio cholerae]|nr:type III secretion system protein [Vibrio cholerae]